MKNFASDKISCKLSLRLFRNKSKDARVYNIPSSAEVTALIVGDFDSSDVGRDVFVQMYSRQLQRIDETHIAFIAL